jgi:regulator of cell morphogenesis and NO signaling
MDELIDHILLRYHQPLRHDLPALIAAAARVERVHRDKPSCPHGLSALLSQVHAELLEHMVKEEKVLFPAILAGRVGSRVQMPVTVMMQEHDDHAVNLQKLCELTGDHRVPPEACATWRALYEALERLDTELKEHIHLENNVLFPRALAS